MKEETKSSNGQTVQTAVPIPSPVTELKEANLTRRDAMLEICDQADFWFSTEGDSFATIPVEGHLEHWPIRSEQFRDWLRYRLATDFTHNGRPASASDNDVREVINSVEARARVSGKERPTALRVAEHHNAIYIDLGKPDWSALKVTGDGWSSIAESPVPILRTKRTAPFSQPGPVGDFRPLRDLLSHLDEDTFILIVAWCLGALLPRGPFPILVLGGEGGAGKSTLARLMQRITDPNTGDLLQPPGNDRDLIAAAKHNRVLSFDNLSRIKPELADSLCRLSTGSEIGGRALHTDNDLASFKACRPLIINGIPDLAVRSDLADRSIVIRLSRPSGRITEKDWEGRVEKVLPPTFAALLDALSDGLGALQATPTPDVRMADFARLVVAAEPKMPWEPGRFIQAYERSRMEVSAVLAAGDAVASAVRSFTESRTDSWSGRMSELYKELSKLADQTGPRPSDWPGSANRFGERLRRATPPLREVGIHVSERRRSHGVEVTLSTMAASDTTDALATFATLRHAGPASDLNGAGVARAANVANKALRLEEG